MTNEDRGKRVTVRMVFTAPSNHDKQYLTQALKEIVTERFGLVHPAPTVFYMQEDKL